MDIGRVSSSHREHFRALNLIPYFFYLFWSCIFSATVSYPWQGFFSLLFAGLLREISSRSSVRLFFGQFFHVFPHESLELVFISRHQQSQPQVRVSEQRRERPTRLQRVLRAFLQRPSEYVEKSKNNI